MTSTNSIIVFSTKFLVIIIALVSLNANLFSTESSPVIISRKNWNAKDPVGKGKEHQISLITIHHTATLQNKKLSIEKKLQNLQNFSQSESRLASGKLKPVWFDIPYHYYIAFDGKIAEGREITFAGDTNTDYDSAGHALIVLEGNFETEEVSNEQQKSLQELVIWLADKYNVSADKIKGHNDFAKTACPGKNLKKLLPILSERSKTGNFTAQTQDCFGDTIPDAKIIIKNEKFSRKIKSNKDGFFTLQLPNGVYEIVVEKCGFKKLQMTDVSINDGLKQNLNLILEYHLASHESNECNPYNKICKPSN